METQSKQRIVGVVVLLILVAAIVALLFYGAKQNESLDSGKKSQVDANKTEVQLTLPVDGQSQTASTTGIDRTPRGTVPANRPVPVNEQTSGEAAQPQTPQNPSTVANTTASDMVVNDGKVDNSASTTALAPANSAQTPVAAIPASSAAPATEAPEPAATAEDEEPAVATKVATPINQKNAKKVVKVYKKAPTVSYANRGAWAVCTGSFIAPPNADNMAKKLRAHGYKVYRGLVVTNKGVLSQVLVGPLPTRAAALALVKDLQKTMHIRAVVVNTAKIAAKTKAANKKVVLKKKKVKKVLIQQPQAQ
ncbi:MAG: SPOR domain-containing protein [Gammaproteobacteria bacterium]